MFVSDSVKEFFTVFIILLGFVGLGFAVTPDEVYPTDIKTATELCEKNGGWSEIRHQNGATRTLTCANTAEFTFQLDAKE